MKCTLVNFAKNAHFMVEFKDLDELKIFTEKFKKKHPTIKHIKDGTVCDISEINDYQMWMNFKTEMELEQQPEFTPGTVSNVHFKASRWDNNGHLIRYNDFPIIVYDKRFIETTHRLMEILKKTEEYILQDGKNE